MYELYYWPEIQGRGELVRVVLEDAGVAYDDVGRRDPDGVAGALDGVLAPYAFALPALRAGDIVVAQSALIARYVGEHHGLAPRDERGRLACATVALTLADLVTEVHDTHHPLSVELRYERQRVAARTRARAFRQHRLPKFLGYLERALGDHDWLVAGACSYVDLMAFQVIEGLRYAFPLAMAAARARRLDALHDRVAARPRLAAYLVSDRRLPFSDAGIFRHYRELDAAIRKRSVA
ncbi:MAG TPA: glutathione S-transferase [Kofleriaceae bacterium]|nr:glutathione S-transferase [Kofleriaceae bacterium]